MSRQQIVHPIEQIQTVTPAVPPAGHMKLYPKSDTNFYKLSSTGQEVMIGGGVVSDEVLISQAPPRDQTTELWYDTSTSPGTLKAKVNGTWETVGGSAMDPWGVDANGNLVPNTDNTYSIGSGVFPNQLLPLNIALWGSLSWGTGNGATTLTRSGTFNQPGMLEMKNGLTNHQLRIYGTSVADRNFTRLLLRHDRIATQVDGPQLPVDLTIGTEGDAKLLLMTNFDSRWEITPVGNLQTADLMHDTIDIGDLEHAPQYVYVARGVNFGSNLGQPHARLHSEPEGLLLTVPNGPAHITLYGEYTDANNWWGLRLVTESGPASGIGSVARGSHRTVGHPLQLRTDDTPDSDIQLWTNLAHRWSVHSATGALLPIGLIATPTVASVDIGIETPVTTPYAYQRVRHLFLGGVVSQMQIARPLVNPPLGTMYMYPKADGNYYSLDPLGTEKILGGGQITFGSVYPQLSFGMGSNTGSSLDASRADHSHGTPNHEVVIQPDDPLATHPFIELWHDTTASPGTLKARVGNVWEEVGGASGNEVFVGPDEPTEPTMELWYDEDAVAIDPNEVTVGTVEPVDQTELWYNPAAAPPSAGNVPPGGLIHQGLIKLSDADQDVGWRGVLRLDAGLPAQAVGSQVNFGGHVYLNSNIYPVGTVVGTINMGSVLGKKINLYATTFGLGMESGTLVAFVPAANKFAVRQDTTTGTEWFAVNNTAAYYKGVALLTTTTGDARYGRKGGQCYTNAGFVGPWDGGAGGALWTVNLMGGSYIFILTVSGTVGTNNQEGTVQMKVDGTVEVTVTNYFNSANQHHNFVGTGAGSYGAGNHTITIHNSTNMQSDGFDRASVTIIEV